MSSLIEIFFDGKEELLAKIKVFESKHNLKLLSRLKSEDNKVQFLSTITEINFGLFLMNLLRLSNTRVQ